MLAVNISRSLRGAGDPRAEGSSAYIRECAERWWAISDATLDGHADILLAVADNKVAGVYAVSGWHRDAHAGDKIVFDLADAADWRWLIGADSPVTWSRGQANPVRKIDAATAEVLRARRPAQQDSGGWSIEIDHGGGAATVRGPQGQRIAVTHVEDGAVRLEAL